MKLVGFFTFRSLFSTTSSKLIPNRDADWKCRSFRAERKGKESFKVAEELSDYHRRSARSVAIHAGRPLHRGARVATRISISPSPRIDPLVPMHATDLSTCPRIIRRPNQLSPWPDSVSRATTVCLLSPAPSSAPPLLLSPRCSISTPRGLRAAIVPETTHARAGAPFDPLLRPQTEERGASVKMLLLSGEARPRALGREIFFSTNTESSILKFPPFFSLLRSLRVMVISFFSSSQRENSFSDRMSILKSRV